jgi:uncharacterized protein (TIGR03437 family)
LTRFLALFAAVTAVASAQFYGLATPADGSSVYFTTTLRLKGTPEANSGKIFAADERGVRLVRSRVARLPERLPNPGNCFMGELYSFRAVELSADGRTMAAQGFRATNGQCRIFTSATLLSTANGSRDGSGILRISANARWAIVDTSTGPFSNAVAAFVDLQSGAQTPIDLSVMFALGGSLSFAPGRTIGDDGTATLSLSGRAFIARPGAPLQPFPVSIGPPFGISASGARILYTSDGLHVFDMKTQQDWPLTTAPRAAAGFSDDGNRVLFLQDRQLYIVDIDGGGPRQVSNEPDGIDWAVLSGNGKVAYAVTGSGRLVKVLVETGATTELVGRTLDISTGGVTDAGFVTTVYGRGFSDRTAEAQAPFPNTLAGVSVTVGGRQVPILRVSPTQIDVLLPWDLAAAALPVVVSGPPLNSPFEAPEGTVRVGGGARAGALFHQDWSPLTDLSPHVGEIIHVYAVGLGAVTPEVVPGAAAAASEPFARLASPMSCSNAEVLYAGLAPGTVARVYQVDLRMGSKPGYQPFACQIGSGTPFAFLTLNVVP